MQAFWSGELFFAPGEASMLAYDLACILVSEFARDWGRFRAFALSAQVSDGGHAAALDHLGVDLGHAVSAMFDRADQALAWQPAPTQWTQGAAATATGSTSLF